MLLNKPTTAAITYPFNSNYNKLKEDGIILIFDLWSDTFNCKIIKINYNKGKTI